MKKKIIIGFGVIVLLAGIGLIIVFNMDWGQYESTLEKSEIVNEETDTASVEALVPSFNKLSGTYSVDASSDNAEILFEVDGLKNTKGGFGEFNVSFEVNESVESASIIVNIDAATINTGNKMRDEHLLEEGFFNTAKYPKITFKSDQITWSEGVYTANGELTLLATTKPLSFDFNHLGSGTNKNKADFEAFEGTFTFDRTEYGMEEDASVGNEVTISFYLELVK